MGKRKHGNGIPMGYQWDTNWSIWSPQVSPFSPRHPSKKKHVFSQVHVEYPPRDRPSWDLSQGFLRIKITKVGLKKWFSVGAVLHSFTLPLWNKCSFHAINSAIQPPKTMRFKSLLSSDRKSIPSGNDVENHHFYWDFIHISQQKP